MNRLAFAFLALSACTFSSNSTSSGELTLAEHSGGFCDNSVPWCGYDVAFDASSSITVTSRSAPANGYGALTDVGQAKLDDLIARLPINTPDDNTTNCADAPEIRLHIDFDEVGPKTYRYSCTPGKFEALGNFVFSVASAIITGTPNADVAVAVEKR